MDRHEATLDWVEDATGQPYGHACADGCSKVVVSEPKMVHGHLAAHMECTVCGARGFHWVRTKESQR